MPDVAGDGDPETGYKILVDGQIHLIGGTSAVAPLWAGLIARINQKLGHSVGFINPILYQNPGAFTTSSPAATPTTTPVRAGTPAPALGSPKGTAILQALRRHQPVRPDEATDISPVSVPGRVSGSGKSRRAGSRHRPASVPRG